MKVLLTVAAATILPVAVSQAEQPALTLKKVSTFHNGPLAEIFDEAAAEIVQYHAPSKQLFIVNGHLKAVDIVNIQDPASPVLVSSIKLKGAPTSVTVHPTKNEIAIAVPADKAEERGHVIICDTMGKELQDIEVGFLPDMLTYDKAGDKILVANEGEANEDYSMDPAGSVSLLVRDGEKFTHKEITFDSLTKDQLEGVRLAGKAGVTKTPAQDLEPEYISISPDNSQAFVSLQENNAVAVIDLKNGKLVSVLSLGFKDHSKTGNGLDASNKDKKINITNWPLKGLYMPDAISSYTVSGKTYFVTANEGDSREREVEINGEKQVVYTDEARVKDIELDPSAFPNAAELQDKAQLGRIKIVSTEGDKDGDGKYEELYSFGGRSFSIFDSTGKLVFDSGDQFERIIAEKLPEDFGSTNDENESFDDRSDDKGPEPEGIELAEINGKTYAFIALERMGGIMIYNITDPANANFIDYINTRDFAGKAKEGTAGDLAPEGLHFIPADRSPTGKPMLAAAFEVSGTTALFEVISK